ncbi:hypothetical protein CVT24_002440 [Panaeolus cyanescens]|uniref:Uncharacterized protein n=1 Tax=Panaeolus cyanescens TaxID=181874 RepID=A0A409WVA1_9AGAR|nr:hypothetical protein CVT24_002440 [Panaeolus cyanescens]
MEVSGPYPANGNASSQSNKALETMVTAEPRRADGETKSAPPKELSDVMKAGDASGKPPAKNEATARKAIIGSCCSITAPFLVFLPFLVARMPTPTIPQFPSGVTHVPPSGSRDTGNHLQAEMKEINS